MDVEAHRDGRRFEALARRYFSVPEQEALSSAGPEDMAGHFYDTWTLKEAWLKARGSGIRVPLADFGFHRDGARLSFSATPTLDPRPSDWRFWCWRLGRQASLSLAIRDPARVSGAPLIRRGLPLGNWDPFAPEARAGSDW
ncbi:MAG: 4'-phosphopantetheinyl transferase family protein [Gammaproteobacteria bacterium]